MIAITTIEEIDATIIDVTFFWWFLFSGTSSLILIRCLWSLDLDIFPNKKIRLITRISIEKRKIFEIDDENKNYDSTIDSNITIHLMIVSYRSLDPVGQDSNQTHYSLRLL